MDIVEGGSHSSMIYMCVLMLGGWLGWWVVKSKLKLISAKAEPYASSLGLAELGKIYFTKLYI